MSALAFVILIAAGAPADVVDITLAPDQPIPRVYMDDPLVIEFTAKEDLTVSAQLEILQEGKQLSLTDLGSLRLGPGAPHWYALEELPETRGRYVARIVFTGPDGSVLEKGGSFCRVDRPSGEFSDFVGLALGRDDPHGALRAAAGIPVRWVRLPADHPQLADRAAAAIGSGLGVRVAFDLDRMTGGDGFVEGVASELADSVTSWEVDAGSDPSRIAGTVTAIRRGGSRAPFAIVARDASSLEACLTSGAGQAATGLVLRAPSPTVESVTAFRDAAERAGYEGLPITILAQGVSGRPAEPGPVLVRNLTRYLAAGGSELHVDVADVYGTDGFQTGYPFLSALTARLDGGSYLGRLPSPDSVEAYVFRNVDQWTIVVVCPGGEQETGVELGSVMDVTLRDACNNVLPVGAAKGGVLTLRVGEKPCFLSGTGGDVLARAAAWVAREEAARFAATPALQESLPSEFMDVVRLVAAPDSGKLDRLRFFTLLRMFPRLERDWRSGTLPASTAVPALAQLGRLVRSLCVLEQESGEEFLEPIEKTMARCDGYKSQYLTSSGGSTGGLLRGDWLLSEVTRLMTEAETLRAQGRLIEANGVAALAEWRARSLEVHRSAAGGL
ncbi:MAG: hypothetical protein GY851_15095 [bacterium]|nr:hypothetical protein [bacterium]